MLQETNLHSASWRWTPFLYTVNKKNDIRLVYWACSTETAFLSPLHKSVNRSTITKQKKDRWKNGWKEKKMFTKLYFGIYYYRYACMHNIRTRLPGGIPIQHHWKKQKNWHHWKTDVERNARVSKLLAKWFPAKFIRCCSFTHLCPPKCDWLV